MNQDSIAARLVALRGNRSQQEVADALGISASAVCDYERGKRIPNDCLKLKFAAYYGEKVEQLFYDP